MRLKGEIGYFEKEQGIARLAASYYEKKKKNT